MKLGEVGFPIKFGWLRLGVAGSKVKWVKVYRTGSGQVVNKDGFGELAILDPTIKLLIVASES